MAEFVCVFRRIHDFEVVGEVEVSDLSYALALNGFGEMSGTVPMRKDGAADALLWTTPKRFVVCVERDGAIVWSGPIWTRTLDFGDRTIRLAANEWGSVLTRFFLVGTDFDYDDQTHVVLESITNALSSVLPITTPVQNYVLGATPTVVITGVFPEASHLSFLDAIDQLAKSEFAGFEYGWRSYYDGSGMLMWEMRAGAPCGYPQNHVDQPIYEHYPPGQNGAAMATPATAQTVLSYTLDEQDVPNEIVGFNANGDNVVTATLTYPGAPDDPLHTQECITYSELNDDEIVDRVGGRLAIMPAIGAGGIYQMRLHVANPMPANVNVGLPGDWIRFFFQLREDEPVGDKQLRLIGLRTTVTEEGEAMYATLTDGSA